MRLQLVFGCALAALLTAATTARAQRAGRYLSVRRIGDSEILLGHGDKSLPALKSVFEITQKDQDTLSVIILAAHRNTFIKMRCTYPRYLKAQAEKSFEVFLKEFSVIFKGEAPKPQP